MNDEVRKLKNEYMKKWRAKNKDKVREAQKRYWNKKLKEVKSEAKEYGNK